MLSRLKSKNDASAPSATAWHPNFRNYQKLPDIKVVRTAFFINGAAVLVVVSLVILLGFKEWQLHAVSAQTSAIQNQIDRDKKLSDQSVALFKSFQAEEAKANEVDAFVKSRAAVSTIVLRMGETLPKNVALDLLDFRENGLVMRLSVRGTPDVASGYATTYLEQLRTDSQLKLFEDFTFTGTPSPNPATNRMAVEFFLRFKGASAVKK